MSKKVMVTLDDDLAKIIDNIEGMGEATSTKLVNMARCYLSDKKLIPNKNKKGK